MARRPFGDDATLMSAARDEWFRLTPADWLEAFSHHPKIGGRDALRARFANTRHLSAREQQGVDGADEAVLAQLADLNHVYQQRFGYIFIVCATGKSAGEMLALLRARIPNDPAVEIGIAAEEQARITALRLRALATLD